GKHTIGERIAGGGILTRPASKIADTLGGAGDHGRLDAGLAIDPRPLIGAEEEGLIPADGTADGAAELIALEGRDGVGEKVARIQILIAQELEGGAVQAIRAGTRHGIHGGARIAPELGTVVTGLEAEFLERIRIGENR